MNAFYIINKSLISTTIIVKDVEEIAASLDIYFFKETYKEFVKVQLCDKTDDLYFEVVFFDKNRFLNSKNGRDFLPGYGVIGRVDFQFEDTWLFQFIKRLFEKHPEMLIYYEEGHATHDNPFTYSKSDIDANESLDMLTKPAN